MSYGKDPELAVTLVQMYVSAIKNGVDSGADYALIHARGAVRDGLDVPEFTEILKRIQANEEATGTEPKYRLGVAKFFMQQKWLEIRQAIEAGVPMVKPKKEVQWGLTPQEDPMPTLGGSKETLGFKEWKAKNKGVDTGALEGML